MIRQLVGAFFFLGLTLPAIAQESGAGDDASVFDDDLLQEQPDVAASSIQALQGSGALLRGLDKLNAAVSDLELTVGETAKLGRISVTLGECRYPEDNQSGEAFAWLKIQDDEGVVTFFEGWMVASSPALSALDHPRYDVWVIRCTTP